MDNFGYHQLDFENAKEKFNILFPHKYHVYNEVCIIDNKNKNPFQRAIVTRCFPRYVKDDAVSYEVELILTKEKIKVTENELILPANIKDDECSKVKTNVEPVKITAVSGEKNINDNMIDTGVEKVQVIEDKLEDLNKNLDKKLDKVSKLTKLLFVSHFI